MIVSPCEWFALGQEMRPSPLAAENPSHQYRDRHEWCQAKALQRTETWPKGQLRLKPGSTRRSRWGLQRRPSASQASALAVDHPRLARGVVGSSGGKLLVHVFGNRRCARSAGGRRDSSGRLTASAVLQRDLRGTQECLGDSLDRTSANRLGGVAQRKLTLFLRP